MNKLTLIKPNLSHFDEIAAMRDEILAYDEEQHINGSSGLQSYDDITDWLNVLPLYEHRETVPNSNHVVSEQYLLVREGESRILGMIALRHYLNDALIEHGGHIGYSVRPNERRKGYAKAMLSLCLEKAHEIGIDRVMLDCNVNNIASRRTILACGGRFEQKSKCDGFEQYWIDCTSTS
ncbi:MAG: GNAT family N-acetyltransferase [Oscillospiraceae bacterium]|nr:GNAT family N-acetyltransferase [Oscillospiraceae bacterium]